MSTDEFDLTISDAYRTPGRRKNNFTATTSPTTTDDADSQYEVGSVWVDVSADEAWTCVDSTVGNALWVQGGGSDTQSLFVDSSVSGATDVDHDDGWTQDLTLTGNAVLTPIATTFEVGEAIDLRLLIRQDGTGGHTLGWGGTITWATHDGNPPDMPTDPNALLTVGLLSVDDGTTWIGYSGGSGGEPATTVEDETTFGIAPAVGTDTEYARQDHTHGTPDDPVPDHEADPDPHPGYVLESAIDTTKLVGPLLISDTHSTPIIFGDILLTDEEDDFLYVDV